MWDKRRRSDEYVRRGKDHTRRVAKLGKRMVSLVVLVEREAERVCRRHEEVVF
jgi:hypothetical protein